MLFTFIPCISGFPLTLSANVSATSKNKRAEMGQPCLMPRLILKKGEEWPLFVTQMVGCEYNSLIQLINVLPKLKDCKVSNRKSHDTESNAFSKSSRIR